MARYYWYGNKRKGPGRPPKWVVNILSDNITDQGNGKRSLEDSSQLYLAQNKSENDNEPDADNELENENESNDENESMRMMRLKTRMILMLICTLQLRVPLILSPKSKKNHLHIPESNPGGIH